MVKIKKPTPNSLIILVIISMILGIGLGYYFGSSHRYEKKPRVSESNNTTSMDNSVKTTLSFVPPPYWTMKGSSSINSPDWGPSESGMPHDVNGASISIETKKLNSELGLNQRLTSLEKYIEYNGGTIIEKTEINGMPAYSYKTQNLGEQKQYITLVGDSFWNFSITASSESKLNRYLPEFQNFISSVVFHSY